jgi:hypothetical protein
MNIERNRQKEEKISLSEYKKWKNSIERERE